MGDNKYLVTHEGTVHYLEKHSKNVVQAPISQEGSSYTQRKGDFDTVDKRIGKTRNVSNAEARAIRHPIARPSLGTRSKKRAVKTRKT